MTSATTILALIPVLTSTGRGSDIMVPMAIPSFGGMAVVLVTVFLVPVLYCALAEARLGAKRMAEAAVIDANSPEEGDAVAEQVKERFNISTVHRTALSPAIGTHVGPGTVGIAFYATK